MASLERAGVIEPRGRMYRVPRPAQQPGQAGILFTAWVAPGEADLWFRRDRYLELLAAMHRACAESNLRLLVSSYHPRHGFRFRPERAGLRDVTLRGHLVWAPTLAERDLARLCADLAGLHARAKPPRVGTREAPLAIFDGARGTPMSIPRAREYACARIFSIARKRAGEGVARYLLAAGHRRIAFLSACHAEPWSKDRWTGLRQACEAAGFPDAARAFTVAAHDDPSEKPGLPPALAREEAALGAGLAALEAGLAREGHAWLATPLRQAYELFRQGSRTGYALAEAVERMRAWGPTAVVAANDAMALTAMHQLRRSVPRGAGDIAFVGFDDDKYAADGNLTSYNFNMAGIAGSMLQYVLAPEKAPAADRDGAVECQGILIERATTPPARAK
jgi:DNA-binding LacI/PurR family transcriptional regulator